MDTETLAVVVEHVQASQYVAAAGFVVLVYDHLLTFDAEVRLIWKAEISLPKVLFLFNRYIVFAGMLIRTNDFSGIGRFSFSNDYCKWSIGVTTVMGLLTIGISNFLILLRIWVLWDRNRRLMFLTGSAFLLGQITSMVIGGLILSELIPFVVYDPFFHACLITQQPRFKLGYLWLAGLLYEVMVFCLVWWNSLERPRSDTCLITQALYRDGLLFFCTLFALRLINLIIGITAPLSLIFLGVLFIWAATNITLSRFILNLRQLAADAREADLATPMQLPTLPHSHRSESVSSSAHTLCEQAQRKSQIV